nr:immunoglobulin light chain junction region [Macaca mulatta]
CSSYTDSNVLF